MISIKSLFFLIRIVFQPCLIFCWFFFFANVRVDNKTDLSNALPWPETEQPRRTIRRGLNNSTNTHALPGQDTTEEATRSIRSYVRSATNTSHALPLSEETPQRRRPRTSIPTAGSQMMSAFSWEWRQPSHLSLCPFVFLIFCHGLVF